MTLNVRLIFLLKTDLLRVFMRSEKCFFVGGVAVRQVGLHVNDVVFAALLHLDTRHTRCDEKQHRRQPVTRPTTHITPTSAHGAEVVRHRTLHVHQSTETRTLSETRTDDGDDDDEFVVAVVFVTQTAEVDDET
jgi:hypothetical protein